MTQKTAQDFDFIEVHYRAFRQSGGASGGERCLYEYVANQGIADVRLLGMLVKSDLQLEAQNGRRKPVSGYFDAFPQLLTDAEAAKSILNEDFRVKFQAGECDDFEAYRTGCPQLDELLHGGAFLSEKQKEDCFAQKLSDDAQASQSERRAFRDRKPNADSLIGTSIRHYRIVELISRGRRADVFKARDQNLERLVVLKVNYEISRTADREARFLAKLDHSQVLDVHDEFVFGAKQVIVTQFINGVSLADLIQHWHRSAEVNDLRADGGTTSTADISIPIPDRWKASKSGVARASVQMAICISDAIQHAHERGVWHCDIKPSNVLIEPHGNPLLMDFDIAINEGTEPQSPGGTVGYASPEQGNFLIRQNTYSRQQIDHRTDIYSIGVVLFQMLTGELPDRIGTDHSIGLNGKQRTPSNSMVGESNPELSGYAFEAVSKVAGVSHSLASIVRKCLSVDRNDRYQNAQDLRSDLQRWLDFRPLQHADDSDWTEHVIRMLKRRPVGVASLAIVAFLLIGSVWQADRKIAHAETTLDGLEKRLADPESIDAPAFADRLLETKGAVSRNDWLDFLFRTRKRSASDRLQAVFSRLAQRETLDLMDRPFEVQGLSLAGSESESKLTTNLDRVIQLANGEVVESSLGSRLKLFEKAMVELMMTRRLAENAGRSFATAENNLARVALRCMLPSLKDSDREKLLSMKEAVVFLKHVATDGSPLDQADPVPLSPNQWHLLGVVAKRIGANEQARICFQNSVDQQFDSGLLPESATVRQLANSYLVRGDEPKSVLYLEMAAKLDPGDHLVLHRLALLAEKHGKQASAIDYLLQAIKHSPDTSEYHADLGAVYLRQGQLGRAAVALDQAIEQGYPKPDAQTNRAIVSYLTGETGAAIASLNNVVAKFPADATPRELLERLQRRQLGN